ncbi:InlB B-repeat-containing protein [Paenibacillus turpanensis]|uniref:InlB B-repeat-containing protein n=1 Tax=Paenibacillus turpanensis TaxID=2689078 RepID=UPI00140B3CEA|nr:InlB B-repeat-containing protein [Paenibacillus turpanensis]
MKSKMKSALSMLLSAVLATGMLLTSLVWLPNEVKAAGTGTVEDPFIITTAEDLNNVRNARSAHYRLGNDIDLGAYTDNWLPIGEPGGGKDFVGTFDGAGYVIRGLKVNSTSNFASLFGIIGTSGHVHNVGLLDVQVSGSNYVGGLAGTSSGTVSDSYVSGVVSGTGDYVGGLLGRNSYAEVTGSYAVGTVTGGSYVGGLVGASEGYYPDYPLIGESYATVDVTGAGDYVGGLTGTNKGEVRNSYAVGHITGSGLNVGGVFGRNEYSVSNSYYAYDVAGIGTDESYGGMTSAAMKSQITFYGWDFANIWSIKEGQDYPKLKKISGEGDPIMTGSGKETDPYIIKTPAQLSSVRYSIPHIVTHFKLGNDIDLSVYPNWEPIAGQADESFNGKFDGAGYAITGLTIDSGLENVGLFGNIRMDSTIRNVRLTGVNVKGTQNVGAIAGQNAGYIVYSYASGSVSLVGNGVSGNAGGLVGRHSAGGSLSGNYSDVNVVGTGLAGANAGIGGLAGHLEGQIFNGYATGSVSADAGYVGGLVGKGNGSINYGYAIGSVNAGSGVAGGLAGDRSQIYVHSSYYDAITTGMSDSDKGAPKTTTEMQTQSTFTGWDFTTNWYMKPESYPKLRAFLKTYAVTYNGNGSTSGSAPVDAKQYEAGDLAAVLAKPSTLTREGYSFEGWNTAADGSGTTYRAGDSISIAGGVTLYAQWQFIRTYTIGQLENLTLAELTEEYTSGTQEKRTVTVTKTGTEALTNLTATLSGAGAGNFELEGPVLSTLDNVTTSTTFTVRAKDALPAETYTATVTVSADNMADVSFTVKQIVQSNVLKGDGNDDGLITPADALMITQYLSGTRTLTPKQIQALDVNNDGTLSSLDVQMIMAIYLGRAR